MNSNMANEDIYDDLNDPLIMEDKDSWAERSQISQFYTNKHVFVTGGTGFMGLILVEKLLRSCPNMAALYILIRPKKGKTVEERLRTLFDTEIFEPLKRKKGASFMDCVVPIAGDVGDLNLGISSQDRHLLEQNVQIIFHAAANVRFDAKLSTIAKTNIRGTQCIVDLAKNCNHLQALVHVSTAYSNCMENHIKEKFYNPIMSPNKIMKIADECPDAELDVFTKKFIDGYPNTYAISKQIGENVIKDSGLPACVFRPSIVISTNEEPITGWTNNLYGPVGVTTGVYVGLLRTLECEKTNRADMVPVDMSINAMIACAWEVANTQTGNSEPRIYNFTPYRNPISWGKFMHLTIQHGLTVPPMMAVWYYGLTLNRHHRINVIYSWVLHLLPAFLVDCCLAIKGKTPIALPIFKKIRKLDTVISFFSKRQWKFDDHNILNIINQMTPEDKLTFPMDIEELDWNKFLENYIRGVRVYLLRDDYSTLPEAKVRYRKMAALYFVVLTIIGAFAFMIFWKILGNLF